MHRGDQSVPRRKEQLSITELDEKYHHEGDVDFGGIMDTVLASFMSTWHKHESLEWRKSQLGNYLRKSRH